MRRAAVALVAVAACAACAHKTTSPPVPTVVPGPTSSWEHITISAGPRSVEVPPELRGRVAPLRASRGVLRPVPAEEYGLDHPQAQLSYRATGRAADVLIGSANFDRHFLYARRAASATVYILPADSLRPVLALVGIDVAPPD